MIPTVTLGLAGLFCLLGIISIVELGLIYGYTGKKAPGMLTQLDLLISDCIRIWIPWTILMIILVCIGTFHGQLGTYPALILYLPIMASFNLLIASFQVTLTIKGILIFKDEWINEISDRKVLMASRIAIWVYSSIIFAINFLMPAKHSAVLDLLTEKDQPTKFGFGLGSALSFLILLLSLLIMVIKISCLEDQVEDSGKTQLALYAGIVGCMIFPIGMIGNSVNKNFLKNSDYEPSYHLKYVVPMLCMIELIVGIVIPTLYFSSKPNLVNFSQNIFKSYFSKPWEKLWNLCTVSNRIVDLDGKV